MLGSSGTVTTLAGIHLALPRYIRAAVDGSSLTFDQIAAVSAHLAGLDLAGRAAQPVRRPRARRSRAWRLRHPRGDLRALAGRPPARRRPRRARGHPVRSDPGIRVTMVRGRRPATGRWRCGCAAPGGASPLRPTGCSASSTTLMSPRRDASAIAPAPPSS